VFHNQIRLGEIEIAPNYKYSTETPHVMAHIELDWVRLFAFGTIRDFLTAIARHITDYRSETEEYEKNRAIDRALMEVLWKTQEISQFGLDDEPSHGEIEVRLQGLAIYYCERRESMRRQAAKAKQPT
jgi:hypothetical protein